MGLICPLSFYGTEISGSQEVIEIGEVTKVVVGESPEEILQYSSLPSSKRAGGFLSASCAFSTKGQRSWKKMVQSLGVSWGKELVVYPNQSRKPGAPNPGLGAKHKKIKISSLEQISEEVCLMASIVTGKRWSWARLHWYHVLHQTMDCLSDRKKKQASKELILNKGFQVLGRSGHWLPKWFKVLQDIYTTLILHVYLSHSLEIIPYKKMLGLS